MTKTRDLADLGGGFIQAGSGAVQRTVEAKLQDVVSVKDFGAVGDGVADDTAAIQAAINSIPTDQAFAYGIYFPTGNYLISSSLTVTNRLIVFSGDGPSTSVIRPTSAVTNAFDVNCTGFAATGISGFFGLGIKESGSCPSTTLLKISNTKDVFLANLFLQCSGRLIDYGPNNECAVWDQIRGEAYGAQEAIRFRSGGGTISNVFIRKFDTAGSSGPVFWWQGDPVSTSLKVTNSSFGGSGYISRSLIQSITSTASTFTVNTTAAHNFIVNDWVVVRDPASAYYGTWLVASKTSTSVTVNSTLNAGTETPSSKYLESLSACLYVDSSIGPCNESIFNGVMFEGIDGNGTCGKIGSASVWLDARVDSGSGYSTRIYGHRYSNCYFDVGQLGLVAQSALLANEWRGVQGIKVQNSQIMSAKIGVYLQGTASIQLTGNTFVPVTRTKAQPNDLYGSCGVWLNGLVANNKAVQIQDNIINRQTDWNVAYIALSSAEYGIRVDGNNQDIYITGNHIYGILQAAKLEGQEGGTVLLEATRAVIENNMLASGSGESLANCIPTVASATSITLGLNSIYQITGTTAIQSISGGWIGRTVRLITVSGLRFTGAGFNNPLKTVAGDVVTATFDGTKWSLNGAPSWTAGGNYYIGDSTLTRMEVAPGSTGLGENLHSYTNNYYIWGIRNESNSLAIESAFAGDIIFKAEADGVVSSPGSAVERARISKDGPLLIGTGTNTGGALLQVNGNRIRVATALTPASAAASGTAGEICWDANYVYVCTAANTWKRAAIAAW